ncbi:MAG TPA: MFS transporter [Acidobacteriaceae bacterium]|nr:MFS transporter [Acidobacteriaceae bacterium]
MTPRDISAEDAGQPELPELEEPLPAAAPQGTSLSATEPAPTSDHAGGISHAWRALRAPNFRLFFSGQSISLIGTWMTRIATSWLVYRLTGSAWLLGTVSFMGQIPTFLIAPFAGVWVDRWNKRTVLVWTQALAAAQSLALAALTLTHRITIADILALSALQGLINAFDMPGRQAFMVEMVDDKRDLGNAIALNSSIVNLARLIGPSLAGVVIALYGEGWCFLVDGVSYFAVIASLLMMHLRPLLTPRRVDTMFEQLREGWQYITDFLPIRNLLLLFAVVSLMGMPYTVLMPVFASQVLHGGPHTLGFLMAAAGVGALIAAVQLALRKSVKGLLRMVPISAAVFGAGLIAFGFSHILWLSLALMLVVGFGMMQGMAATNTIIQTLAPADKRGRVMSFYTMAFVGMAPFGSLLAGGLAHVLTASWTVIITGSCCILGAAWFWRQMGAVRDAMRPVYRELGITRPAPETN